MPNVEKEKPSATKKASAKKASAKNAAKKPEKAVPAFDRAIAGLKALRDEYRAMNANPEPVVDHARQLAQLFFRPGPALLDGDLVERRLAGGQEPVVVDEDETDDGVDVDEDEPGDDPAFKEEPFLQFLYGLREQIVSSQIALPPVCRVGADRSATVQRAKHAPGQALGPVPGLKVVPFDHQVRAAAVTVRACASDFKGVIIADPPGLGKTLTALMVIAKTAAESNGPSVIVAPNNLCAQWVAEIGKYFEPVRPPSPSRLEVLLRVRGRALSESYT